MISSRAEGSIEGHSQKVAAAAVRTNSCCNRMEASINMEVLIKTSGRMEPKIQGIQQLYDMINLLKDSFAMNWQGLNVPFPTDIKGMPQLNFLNL